MARFPTRQVDGRKNSGFVSAQYLTQKPNSYSPDARRARSSRNSSVMLALESRTSSANGAFGRQERHDSAGMRLVTAASGWRSSVRRSMPLVMCQAAATISAGEWVTAAGDRVNDRTHGQQFRARFLKTSEPTSVEGREKYLPSGMIRGIGPAYAKRLLRAFGEKVFDVIETQADRLREVDGIGPVRVGRIVAAWAEQKMVREIMVFLHSHGVGTARAVRIFKTYGSDAIQVMTENPYRLARDIRGIGFKTADAIAIKLGIEKTAMVRVRAGISYALTEAMDEGHCGLPTDELRCAENGLQA